MMPRSVAVVSAILVVLAGCTSGTDVSPGSSPTSAAVQPSPSAASTTVPSAASPSAAASAIDALECEGDVGVTGINDYQPGATGIDEACQDSATPTAQTGTAIGKVVADGVRVRSLPTVHPASIKYEPLLRSGDRVFVGAGPVAADGYDWFLVDTLYEGGEPPLFGWAAFESRDGETWIAGETDVDCPALPGDARRLGVTNDDVLLHCFGSRDLTFELDASLYCSPDDPARVEHDWLALECSLLSGDACGTCGMRIAAHPDADIELPDRDSGRWAMTGHFDDPAAANCAKGQDADGGLLAEWAVHYCRTTFVLTALERR